MDIFVRNCTRIAQEVSNRGIGGPRRTEYCNIQDLFDFLGFGYARGFQNCDKYMKIRILNGSEPVPKHLISLGFKVLIGSPFRRFWSRGEAFKKDGEGGAERGGGVGGCGWGRKKTKKERTLVFFRHAPWALSLKTSLPPLLVGPRSICVFKKQSRKQSLLTIS